MKWQAGGNSRFRQRSTLKVLCFPEKLILQNYDINKKMSKK